MGSVFGVSLNWENRTPLERCFPQTSPLPKTLCGAQRTFEGDKFRDSELRPTIDDKRVLIYRVDPDILVQKSGRKVPKAIENQKSHESKRQQCLRAGIEPEWPITFRKGLNQLDLKSIFFVKRETLLRSNFK